MEFLKEIKEDPNNRSHKIDAEIITILVKICNRKINVFAKLSAVIWIHEFLKLLLKEYEVNEDDSEEEKIEGEHFIGGSSIRQAVFSKFSQILEPILFLLSDDEDGIEFYSFSNL